jgi:hypothetical protein
MSDERHALAAFEDEVLAAVAAEHDFDADALAALVERHQERVRDLPGVEDVVYEWRSQFHEDPLVHRSEAVYVLAHRPHVWDEYVEAMELSETESRTLRAVHDAQARGLAGTDQLSSGEPMVLTRP